MDSIAKTLLVIGLLLIGSAAWVIAERLRWVEPMCLVDNSIWEEHGNR